MTDQQIEALTPRTDNRVFVVEDELLIEMLLEDLLDELGFVVAAVATNVKDGLRIAELGEFDFAILDVNLNGEKSIAIAMALEARGLPYIFATGYADGQVDGAFKRAPILVKPYGIDDLRRALPKIS